MHLKGYGTTDYTTGAPAVDASTMYDLASLTKVVATTTAAMILEDEGKLDISRPVQSYLPEFNAPDKATITCACCSRTAVDSKRSRRSGRMFAGAPIT